ncbi:MAG TPA: type II toxin-antitoxin system VapC family toxin [Pseudonocardiaceae bacterium]|nr:type II toxin-antitoxin system VapC family toxin [Pseudonocardiaceae bacterium]
MEPVVLDTDVASLIIKGKLPVDAARLLVGRVPIITFVTLAELTRWVEQRQWGPHRRERLAQWLAGKHVLHSNDDVARTWGTITAYASRRGRPRPMNDSWIAACCLSYDVPLATLNVRDYEDFASHEGLIILGQRH